jgi:hypothetical protein
VTADRPTPLSPCCCRSYTVTVTVSVCVA